MILQLEPTLPLDTPEGPARAHFLLDYGEDQHLFWICFVDATGECWTFANPQIRLQANPTMGVRADQKDRVEEYESALAKAFGRSLKPEERVRKGD